MPFKFNPLTGNLDLVNTSTGGSGTDHHSGFYYAPDATIISEFKQSVTYGILDLEGSLEVDGQLIMEL